MAQELKKLSTKSWGQVAAQLLAFEKDESKKRQYRSMASYIRALSERESRNEATLWRLLSAGRFYEEIRARLISQGQTIPALEDPDCKAAVESLELLNKISRVVPKATLEPLEISTLMGETSRRELRVTWETYRPVLEGKTKRGRGKKAPKYDSRNARMRGAMEEARVIARIADACPSLFNLQSSADLFRPIPTRGKPYLMRVSHAQFDLLVVTKATDEQLPAVHGIKVLGRIRDIARARVLLDTSPADFFWISLPDAQLPEDMALFDERIGVFCVAQKSVSVSRPATPLVRTEENAEYREQLLRFLLAEFSKSH